MADQATLEMISAFAAGCMDKENFVNLKEYIHEGKDLPYEDLGELQNIVAMVPAILEVEKPNADLKTRVAKRLIELNKEIQAKKREEQEKKEKTGEKKTDIEPQQELKRATVVTKERSEDALLIKKARENEEDEAVIKEALKKEPIQTKVIRDKAPVVEEKNLTFYLPHIISGILFLLIIIMYFISDSSISTLESEIEEMKTELATLNEDYSRNLAFTNSYMALIEFFHYNDISVVNLDNTDSSVASGKLFLSFEEREALIQVNNMPALSPEQVFELWYVTNGVSISMGVFVPKLSQKYLSIADFPNIPRNDIDLFRVTIESAAGTDTPTGELVLFGTLVQVEPQTPPRGRRR